jgi:Icc-related predicted phosphoesterase
LVDVDKLLPKFAGDEGLEELEGHAHERRGVDDVGRFEVLLVLALHR